jgi:Uncharacterized protein conserved in bacteria (DUF2251)
MNHENSELNYQHFVSARKAFRLQSEGASKDDESLMLYCAGPNQLFAVFEDSQKSGWFYLYDAKQRKVVRGAHIYDRDSVAVEEDIVDIGWAADDSACGLALWGQFRAFLGVSNEVEIRKAVTNADEDGIPSDAWPPGFDHYLEKKLN